MGGTQSICYRQVQESACSLLWRFVARCHNQEHVRCVHVASYQLDYQLTRAKSVLILCNSLPDVFEMWEELAISYRHRLRFVQALGREDGG